MFRFFRVGTFCFEGSFAHYYHSLSQLHEAVKEFPHTVRCYAQSTNQAGWLQNAVKLNFE